MYVTVDRALLSPTRVQEPRRTVSYLGVQCSAGKARGKVTKEGNDTERLSRNQSRLAARDMASLQHHLRHGALLL